MNKIIFLIFTFVVGFTVKAQDCEKLYNKKFSKKETSEDIDYIYRYIQNAHINPYTILSKKEFDTKIKEIKASIPETITQREFYAYVKPIFQFLNDEHAAIADYCLPDSLENNLKLIPVLLYEKEGSVYIKDNLGNDDLPVNSKLLAINHTKIDDVLDECSKEVFGVKKDRKPQLIEALRYYLPKYCEKYKEGPYTFSLEGFKEVTVDGISTDEYQKRKKKIKDNSNQLIDLKFIDDYAYLKVNSFEVNKQYNFNFWEQTIDSLFTEIKKENKSNLIVDISENSGGHSKIGNLLINYFYDKPYFGYKGYWKKSKEYTELMKQYGFTSENYDEAPEGTIIELKKAEIIPEKKEHSFKGKTYVIIGKKTFSSAMMTATIIKDNHIATLVGEQPIKGHPNHFGELILSQTPNTQLRFFFGVKEWIRPSEERSNNYLIPDIPIDLWDKTPEMIITSLEAH